MPKETNYTDHNPPLLEVQIMESIYPKNKYTINQAVSHAAKIYGDKNIIEVIEAGDKELNHIVVVHNPMA